MSIGRIGLPVAISQGGMAFGAAILNRILAGYGPAAVGALMLGNRVEMFVFLPVFGFNSALIPFIGYNIGKGDFSRVRGSLKVVLFSSIAMTGFVGTMVFLWPGFVLSLFKPSTQVMGRQCFHQGVSTATVAASRHIVLGRFSGQRLL